jgi:hypothetical protein
VAASRPVRISRSAANASERFAGRSAPSGTGARFTENRAGTRRATRLFGMFVGVLLVIYLAFAALTLASPSPGVRSNVATWAVFSGMALVVALWGWLITFGRTPRGAVRRGSEIVVRERLGRPRRIPMDEATQPTVVHRYGRSLFGPEPTEFVEVRTTDQVKRTYLVGEEFFARLVVAHEG